jgi:hypothetical protein
VKSRAERNEIYGNWIEGAYYHELELIGPDGQDPTLAREDSDVVGNVLRKTRSFAVVRFGGDGTGETDGRYRFANNTVIVAPGSTAAVFRLFDGIESIEMHNNVFVRQGGGAPTILRTVEAEWTSGAAVIAGRNNWVPTGTAVPSQWTATRSGADPGLVNIAARQLWPTSSSPLVNAGADTTASPPGYPFPSPLPRPTIMPPRGTIEAILPRPVVGTIDIGAYEVGSAPPSCATTAAVGATASTQEAANPAGNAIDGSLATRWSGLGDGATLTVDLGGARELCSLAIAWYRGDARSARFDVQLSATGASYTTVYSGSSSGATVALESVPVAATAGVRYVRIVGHGNSENLWNSITEVRAGTR